MRSIEISARTVAEATRLALEQLGVDEDDVMIAVLQSGDEDSDAASLASIREITQDARACRVYESDVAHVQHIGVRLRTRSLQQVDEVIGNTEEQRSAQLEHIDAARQP